MVVFEKSASSAVAYHKRNKIVLVIQVIDVKLRSAMTSYASRTGQRITYQQLAEQTGLSRATLEALGSRGDYNTTLSTIDTLCSFLKCDISDLLEYIDAKEAE